MREIVRASAWIGFRELVAELGGDADELLAAAHVDPASLAEPDRYLPLRNVLDGLEIAAQRLGRPDFGLLFGRRNPLSSLGPLAVAMLNSPTPREAIDVCGAISTSRTPPCVLRCRRRRNRPKKSSGSR